METCIVYVMPMIAKHFESGLLATMHNRGDFKTDWERWQFAAGAAGVDDERGIKACYHLYYQAMVISESMLGPEA